MTARDTMMDTRLTQALLGIPPGLAQALWQVALQNHAADDIKVWYILMKYLVGRQLSGSDFQSLHEYVSSIPITNIPRYHGLPMPHYHDPVRSSHNPHWPTPTIERMEGSTVWSGFGGSIPATSASNATTGTVASAASENSRKAELLYPEAKRTRVEEPFQTQFQMPSLASASHSHHPSKVDTTPSSFLWGDEWYPRAENAEESHLRVS